MYLDIFRAGYIIYGAKHQGSVGEDGTGLYEFTAGSFRYGIITWTPV